MVYVKTLQYAMNKILEKVITIISVIAFDEAPAVDINDLTFRSSLAPEHIKSADGLSEPFADFSRPNFLLS